jgi:hypothetical protein
MFLSEPLLLHRKTVLSSGGENLVGQKCNLFAGWTVCKFSYPPAGRALFYVRFFVLKFVLR